MPIFQNRQTLSLLSLVKKVLRLQSTFSILIAVLVYTLIASWIFAPSVKSVSEDEGSLILLATDCNDPLRTSIAASIDASHSSILLVTYTLTDKKIITSLKKAAYRGVDVSVIYDPIASPESPFLLGETIHSYPRRKRGLMHQKLLIIDHTIVWLGSANMTPSSLMQHGNIMAAIRSKALAGTIENYASSLCSRCSFLEPPLELHFPSQTLTYFLLPTHSSNALAMLVNKIEAAKKRVFVAMYTFTHQDLLKAILNAKRRGVDVKVLFDKDSISQTSKRAYISCKREGVFCGFRKKTGLLHYKTAIIDDCLVLGSANWTKAAFKSNDDSFLVIDPLTPDLEKWVDHWWQILESEFYTQKSTTKNASSIKKP